MENQQQVRKGPIPCAYCKGIQYYDLKYMNHLSNTEIVRLIDLLKPVVENGTEVQFVNVNTRIKQKISSMGLEHILICS